jgi:hypothetical protein
VSGNGDAEMMLRTFEPGDCTRYTVGLEFMTEDQCREFGHGTQSGGAVLFVFGPASEPHCYTFAIDGPELEEGYFAQKMGFTDARHKHTRNAALHVLAALIGRQIRCSYSTEDLRWSPDWKAALDPYPSLLYDYKFTKKI